jgi:hypothetical protein
MAREVLSTDLMPKGLNDGVVSWKALRLGIAAVEVIPERDAMNTLETEKFMEDELVIVIHKSTDKNALERVPVGVNGETAWLPRDVKIRLPRKFVERLARAQEATFRTDDNPDPRMDEGKVIRRTNGQVFPFQVLHDPSPRGPAWLAKVTREG